MGLYNLDKIFKPQSIAVVGASDREGSIGRALMQNLLEGGFEGNVAPINPTHHSIGGLKALPSLAEVGQVVDLVIIATPINMVPAIVKECVQAGAGGAIIISAGGKETGAAGKELEGQILSQAAKGGLRLVGPNCLGIICPGQRLNASFAAHFPEEGKLAFISQSGAICTAILDRSLKNGVGFSHFVSIGSMLDVDFGDLIDYLGNDPKVSSILLYVENLSNIRKFMSAARAVSRLKPIVVLKAGRSPAGAKAASSHTGALAGEDVVYGAAFRRAGIVRVNTIGELFEVAELMARQPRPRGNRLAVITNGGGPGVMAADAMARYGAEPAELAPETRMRLDEVLPAFWSHNNPIDILGDASPQRYAQALEICLEAKEIDGVLLILTPQAMTDPTEVAETIRGCRQTHGRPVFAAWMGGLDVEPGRQILHRAGVPTYDTPEQAVKAFMYLHVYSRNLEMMQEIPPKLSPRLNFDRVVAGGIIEEGLAQGGGFLDEVMSKKLLAAYGIPVNSTKTASSEDEVVGLAREMGYPLVMKIHSPDITHKTEANGVELGLRSEEEVRAAYQRVLVGARAYNPQAKILGVTVQPMVKHGDYEIILGAKKDPNFGPVIVFGLGGILTEMLQERSLGLPPLNRLLARRLMQGSKVYSLLQGYRNRPPADLAQMEEMIISLSQLLVDFPEIQELDINPVILTQSSRPGLASIPIAVDARVALGPSETVSPYHLVISPYPAQYESTETTTGGLNLFLRPVKPEDAILFEDFFATLSPSTIELRFFATMKTLDRTMLARFTQIDYDREIALVAVEQRGEVEQLVGVARVIADPDVKTAEFAILVGDAWQGKGVGARLMTRCLEIAKERGIRTVWGNVLRKNRQMLAMARKKGFDVSAVPQTDECAINIDLQLLHD